MTTASAGSPSATTTAWPPRTTQAILSGPTRSGTDADVYIIKTDANGNLLWSRKYGGVDSHESGTEVQETADGGFIIGGTTDSFGSYYDDIYLIKTDDAGNEMWSFINGGIDTDVGNAIAITDDEGYIIAGYTRSSGAGESDVYLIRLEGFEVTIKTEVLTPSIQAPGTLRVRVTATNQSVATVVTDVFTRVQLPNGSWYPFGGTWLLGPYTESLPAQDSRSATISHNVASKAPVGSYVYEASIESYPSIDHHSSDEFQVIP